ncbi:type IV toxin-antitoxin system AbiEi family antitoxin domain-containing protein [Streptomonospora halophila]|uniref:type IV toxin-antitoxin system AbiEi family antitoxin domain-containing protein n=1 Tax=Streptomonospora halophila TaxID=427369 RepID=UPI0031E5641D
MSESERSRLPGLRGLAAGQHGVVTRAQALACGLSRARIDGLVRRGRWQRVHTGVYLVHPSGGGDPPLAARVMAVQLALGPSAVAVGPTAVRLWGLHGLPPGGAPERVHVAVPGGGSSPAAGTLRRYAWRPPVGEVAVRGGIRLTTPGRTLRDAVLVSDRLTAVSILDSAVQRGAVAADQLPGLRTANAGRPGAVRTGAWWSLADGRAQSSLESRIRLVCHDAGVPPETLQYPVYRADGTLAGRADLAWPSRGVIAEADGRGPHALPEALYVDRRRQNSMVSTPERLVMLRFTWRDLQRPDEIAAAVRDACRTSDRGRG